LAKSALIRRGKETISAGRSGSTGRFNARNSPLAREGKRKALSRFLLNRDASTRPQGDPFVRIFARVVSAYTKQGYVSRVYYKHASSSMPDKDDFMRQPLDLGPPDND
jgi:hypothetical protein